MIDYKVISLRTLLDNLGENDTKLDNILKRFSCQNEKDLETFLHSKAIIYEKSNIGKTFLLVDEKELEDNNFKIIGFFTLGITSIDISNISSNRRRKMLDSIPGRDKLSSISAYLIGQLGRCDSYSKEKLPGEIILKEAYAAIDRAIEVIGGNLLILECREHMFSKFYEKYDFKKLYDELDNGLYTLYKKIR